MDETTIKQIEAAYQEHYYLILAIRLGIGLLTGLVLLVLGLKKNKRNLGFFGLIACLIAGYISAILPFFVMPIFLWLILRRPAVKVEDAVAEAETDSNESLQTAETHESAAFSDGKEEN